MWFYKLIKGIHNMAAELDRLNTSIVALGVSVDAAVAKIGSTPVPAATAADLTAAADAVDAAKAKLDAAVA
jgi:hypothetical protein